MAVSTSQSSQAPPPLPESPFHDHADRARKRQWRLEDMPWDEPFRFCGDSRREQTICKLDALDMTDALYHFELGSRVRLAQHMVRSWGPDNLLSECLEWHDSDEQRHVRGLRRLQETIENAGEALPRRSRKIDPRRMWRVANSARDGVSRDVLLMNLVVDETVTEVLYDMVARRCHLPLVRALFASCAEDEKRHSDYLCEIIRTRLDDRPSLSLYPLQARVVGHVANLQNAFRPYFRAFAGVSHSTTDDVIAEVFRAVSQVWTTLGPRWQRSPVARIVHGADRSPWMLWLLR